MFPPTDTTGDEASPAPSPASFRRSLGTVGLTAQGLAAIGLTATAMVNIPQIVELVGAKTWLCYLAASLVIVLMCETVILFRKVPAAADGIAGFVRDRFGDRPGNLTAWMLLLGYAGNSLNCLTVFGYYLDYFLSRTGLSTLPVMGFLIGGLLCYALARRDVKLSAMTMLGTETLAVIVVVVLCLLVLAGSGKPARLPEVLESATSFDSFQRGLILAILSFVGFESTATLGLETVDPLKTVPRSLRWSVWISAGLFLFWAYVLSEGLRWLPTDQQSRKDALILLADEMKHPRAGTLINLGGFVCFFGATLANLMALGRVIFALAGRGYLPASLAGVNPRLRTPVPALIVASVIVTLVCSLLSLAGLNVVEMFDATGTFAVLGFLSCYLVVAVTAAFPHSTERNGFWQWSLPVLTTLALLAVSASFLVGSVGSSLVVLICFAVLLAMGALRAYQATLVSEPKAD